MIKIGSESQRTLVACQGLAYPLVLKFTNTYYNFPANRTHKPQNQRTFSPILYVIVPNETQHILYEDLNVSRIFYPLQTMINSSGQAQICFVPRVILLDR